MKLSWIRKCLGLPVKRVKGSTNAEKHESPDRLDSNNAAQEPIIPPALDSKQQLLLLHGPKQEYTLINDGSIPQLQHEREMLVKVTVLGLNPIDWKAPAYNFGLPSLPCISGRDFAGIVLKPPMAKSRIKKGDFVFSASTNYRDYRKSAFQQYLVASDFNVSRVPSTMSPETCAALGVAFVSAAISLGVCLGVNFEFVRKAPGPDLLRLLGKHDPHMIPDDVRDECLNNLRPEERPTKGDWLAIWGASSAVGFMALQLAKATGLRVVCVADAIKYGSQLVEAGADVLVHRHNTEDAISIIREVTKGELRFGLDTVGKESASQLQAAMRVTNHGEQRRAHLAGLTGLPKESKVSHHKVPIKIFHACPEVGESITEWLENLLQLKALAFPKTTVFLGGLGGVNEALEVLKRGTANAQRIVMPI